MLNDVSPKITSAEEFERFYVANSEAQGYTRLTVEALHSMGRYGAPCDCGDEICTGWQMLHVEEPYWIFRFYPEEFQ